MAKNPQPPRPATKRSPGRPPKAGGRIPQADVQRAYRARLAAAGKVVRLVDAALLDQASPAPSTIPDYDPATDGIYDRAMFNKMYDDLHKAVLSIQRLEKDRDRWRNDCAKAEAELKQEELRHRITIKDKIVLQQEIAALKQKTRRTNK